MKKNQGVFVVITTLCIMAGMIGLIANCTGILFAAIIQDMGFKAGNLALYYTIKSIVSALTLKFTVKLALSAKSRFFMALCGLLAGISYMAMYFFTAIWQWYIAAVVCGFAASCVFTAIPVILNNWFRKNNGMIIGLVMSGSGIAGMIFSPITSSMVSNLGWREAAVITGLLNIILVCIPSLLFLKAGPDEEASAVRTAGRVPSAKQKAAGTAAQTTEKTERNTESAARASSKNAGITGSAEKMTANGSVRKEPQFPVWVLPLCLLCISFPALQVNFTNQLSVFALSVGYDLTIGGMMTSFSMAGNCSGKFLIGIMADRIGIFRAMILMLCLGICAMVMFLFAGNSVVLACGASLCLGFLYSLYSTGPALFMLKVYGREYYAEKYASLMAINTFICALSSSAMAYIYDLTGSFSPVFVLFFFMNAATILFVLRLSSWQKTKAVQN